MLRIELPFPPSSLSGHAKGASHWAKSSVTKKWTDDQDDKLRQLYAEKVPLAQIAVSMGRSGRSIAGRAWKIGIKQRDDNWTAAELTILRTAYASATHRGDLSHLPGQLGRSRQAISTKAAWLGLSDATRPRRTKPKQRKAKYSNAAELAEARSEMMKARHASTPHPMLGRTHSAASKALMSHASKSSWLNKTDEERADKVEKQMKARIAKYGSAAPNVKRGSWKAGWREIGGKRKYYRSRWEANYARYLEWLKQRGEIQDWQHEPETFWFDAIKRGVRSYLPDFRVWENDGSTPLHEVKGWMDARSKTTLKRMAKYHPTETIVVIREKQYNDIARKVSGMIDGWEYSDRNGRQ